MQESEAKMTTIVRSRTEFLSLAVKAVAHNMYNSPAAAREKLVQLLMIAYDTGLKVEVYGKAEVET